LPSAADAPEEVEQTDEATEVDEARQALLDAVTSELGDAVVGHHLVPNRDVWVRVSSEAWSDTADYLRNRQRFRFFDYLSAIDWLPSPYGRSLDAAVDADNGSEDADEAGDEVSVADVDKVAGGDTRFQVMARVYSLATGIGLHVKADIGDELAVGTWTETYPGAQWHEREVNEMFGISFTGNADMRNLYLPGDFEGYPLRKDYPLVARLIKPWPGIVDVEPMPEVDDDGAAPAADSAPSTTNPEDSQ